MDARLRTHLTHRFRRTAAVAVALSLGGFLVGCGSDSDESPSAARTASNGDVFNDEDVEFASEMIPHHSQALVMVDMTQGRPVDPDFAKLTEQIRAAQAPEIETMTDWLTAWGEEVPATMRDHANAGHDMSDMGDMEDMGDMDEMDGMTMGDLEAAADGSFEDMWLRMMIAHHEGAIEMARDEIEDGAFGAALDLARSIETSQQEEIDEMRAMLGGQ